MYQQISSEIEINLNNMKGRKYLLPQIQRVKLVNKTSAFANSFIIRRQSNILFNQMNNTLVSHSKLKSVLNKKESYRNMFKKLFTIFEEDTVNPVYFTATKYTLNEENLNNWDKLNQSHPNQASHKGSLFNRTYMHDKVIRYLENNFANENFTDKASQIIYYTKLSDVISADKPSSNNGFERANFIGAQEPIRFETEKNVKKEISEDHKHYIKRFLLDLDRGEQRRQTDNLSPSTGSLQENFNQVQNVTHYSNNSFNYAQNSPNNERSFSINGEYILSAKTNVFHIPFEKRTRIKVMQKDSIPPRPFINTQSRENATKLSVKRHSTSGVFPLGSNHMPNNHLGNEKGSIDQKRVNQQLVDELIGNQIHVHKLNNSNDSEFFIFNTNVESKPKPIGNRQNFISIVDELKQAMGSILTTNSTQMT
jgi:hypothetical protein